MKHLRKIIFCTFLISTLAIIAFAFWFFSGQPDKEQIAKAFPLNSEQLFLNGKILTLYSIDPNEQDDNVEAFHDHKVLKKTKIRDKDFQVLLKRSFIKSFSDKNLECFKPRYGLRISDGKENLDLLISFECLKFESYFKNKKGFGSITKDAELIFAKTLADADADSS